MFKKNYRQNKYKIFLIDWLKKKDWGQPTRLSLDEISRKKGHKKFVTVVSDLDKGSLLEVIDSHKNDEIIEKLEEIPIDIRFKVKEVSVDMWGGFPRVVQKVFPNAKLIIDRFHVMKLVNKSLNELRLLVNLKGLKPRYLLFKNSEDLTDEEQENLK